MKQTINIVNLKCHGCANSIKKGLVELGVTNSVDVDLQNSEVIVDVKSDQDLILIKNKLSKMGYPEVGDANTVLHKAKSFVSCASGRLINETE